MAAIINGVSCAGDVAENESVGFGDQSDGPVGIVADEDTDGHGLSMDAVYAAQKLDIGIRMLLRKWWHREGRGGGSR